MVVSAMSLEEFLASWKSSTAEDSTQPSVADPKTYHRSWRAILHRLEMKYDETGRRQVADLNRRFDGPITNLGKGSQPVVEDSRLIEWWNGLELRFQELDDRTRDKAATVETQYLHGPQGEIVVPEINGKMKRKKKQNR
ncbi:MAG: hypothetical protein IT428_29750 [Planctomycetaceae bacterium]|nr:hypothetical protein [Planctomycetaceae bacterium]